MWRFAVGSPRSIRFASMTSSAAVSSLWRPTSARNSWRLSAEPETATGAGSGSGACSAVFSFSSVAACARGSAGAAAAAGGPISSPVRSSSRVSSSTSWSFRSSSAAKVSSSTCSTKPRSSARSTMARICSDSSNSFSWFCVSSPSVLSPNFVAYPASLRTLGGKSSGYHPPPGAAYPDPRTRRARSLFRAPAGSSGKDADRPAKFVAHSSRSLAAAAGTLGGSLRAPLGKQLDRAVERDRLRVVALAQARVRLAVGDVWAEAAFLQDDLATPGGVGSDLPQRLCGGAAATPLPRLGEERKGVLEGGREQLLLGLERARLLPLLDVRPIPAVPRLDLLPVGSDADDTRQLEQAQRLVERHGVERHRLEERGRARPLLRLLGEDLGDVRAVAPGACHDR